MQFLPFSLLTPLSLSSPPFSLFPYYRCYTLMRRILPSKKSKKRPDDLKIPIPLVGGIHNANLTDNQIDQLLTGRHYNNSSSTATNNQHHHRKASSITEERSNAYDEKPPPRPISSPPILAMPNPRRPFAPKDSVLQCQEYDKTQIENSNIATPPPLSAESNNSDQQSVLVLLPQNWKEIPNHIQREQIMAAPEGPLLIDDSEQWAESSEDSNLQYTSAPQSPLVSDDDPSSTALPINHQYKHHHLSSDSSTPKAHCHQRVVSNMHQPPLMNQQKMTPQRPPAPPEHNVISLEALKRQVDMIQQQREIERREWERRELEHRQREQVMLDKIMDTQRQLERALAVSSNSSNNSSSNRRRISIRPLPREHDEEDDSNSSTPERIQRPQRRRSAPGSPQYHSAVEEDHIDQDDHMSSFSRRRAAAAAAARSSIHDDTAATYMSLPGPHHHRIRRHHPATTTTIMHLHPPPVRPPPPPHATPAGPPPPPPLLYDEWAAAAAAVGWGPPPHYPIAPPFSESAYQDETALYRSYNRRSLRQQQQQQTPGSARIQHRRPNGYHTLVDGPPSLGY